MKKTVKEITRIYNSVAEFSAALAGPFNESLFGDPWRRASVTGSESFTGTPDYENADHLLNYGDSGSLEKMQAVKVRKNAGQGTEIRRRQVNSVVGYAPNVPNYLRGVPVSMIGQNRVRVQSSKVVSIVYNFTVNSGVSEEKIISESVKLLSVIGSMEKAGYRAGLSVMFSATKGAERYNIIVKVKDPGQYMDLRKLAYILVNPSFLRRHCFRAMETEQELREPWNCGYGGVTEGDICKDIVKGTPALKDSKYIGFDDLLNRTPEEIEKKPAVIVPALAVWRSRRRLRAGLKVLPKNIKVMTEPKIYVGTYAKYNAGDLSGDWLSLRDFETYEDLIEACMELHSDEAEPELMIQDCDDMPDGLTVGESISREEFDDIKQALQEESARVPAYSIIDYSDKAIAVTGDTRKIAAELRARGGRFNSRLSCGPGWIFSARKRAEIEALLAGSRTDAQARPEKSGKGRKTLEEWAKGQRDPEDILKWYDSAVKLADGVVLFDHPKIKTEFCFRDEGPDYEFYKELGSDNNLLQDYFIRENMDQNGIAEPDENTDMYIVKYAGEYRPGRVYVQFCNCPEYLNLRREDTIRIATETERSLYLAELARVRKAFRKRLDTYLKRYGTKKLHTWSYWADA